MGRVPPKKRGMDIYTIMLLLSVIFMSIAVIAMLIEARRYSPEYWNTSTGQPAIGMMMPMIR